jgi:hypothetical protein
MRCAAMAMVCRPEEQKRLTVMPGTLTGRPARRAIWRAMLLPVAPSGVAQPISTSSTSAGSMPARATACWTECPPSVAPWVMLKAPFQLLASPGARGGYDHGVFMGCTPEWVRASGTSAVEGLAVRRPALAISGAGSQKASPCECAASCAWCAARCRGPLHRHRASGRRGTAGSRSR